ncbi:MAG: NAD(P)/FAD-dependent oxidoreductase [Candidatus Omnitrophota bacterium]
MNISEYDIIVIGAGPAGMIAAGVAGERSSRVLLLERNKEAGKKLKITGNQRVNITNIKEIDEFIQIFGKNGRFLHNVFAQFFNQDLIEFFRGLGILFYLENNGQVFPKSNKAESIVLAMLGYLHKNKIEIFYDCHVLKITKNRKIFEVVTSRKKFYSKKIILATGGCSYPQTGSTGDGYKIAKSFGHRIVSLRPALVPLESKDAFIKELQGLSLKGLPLRVLLNDKVKIEQRGDLLFTHFGVSGPVILNISREVIDLLTKGEVIISIDLTPQFSAEMLEKKLLKKINSTNLFYKNLLKEFLPPKLIPVFIKKSNIPAGKRINQITVEERRKIKSMLAGFRIKISQPRPLAEAMVTSGGVEVAEIYPKTMESRLVKGLYFAGEIIDIDGNCGGYNLQAAFSTGYVAGKEAAERLSTYSHSVTKS